MQIRIGELRHMIKEAVAGRKRGGKPHADLVKRYARRWNLTLERDLDEEPGLWAVAVATMGDSVYALGYYDEDPGTLYGIDFSREDEGMVAMDPAAVEENITSGTAPLFLDPADPETAGFMTGVLGR